jgi:hypothetical protein
MRNREFMVRDVGTLLTMSGKVVSMKLAILQLGHPELQFWSKGIMNGEVVHTK